MMRIAPFALISTLGLLACGTVPDVQTTETGSETDTDTGTGTETGTTAEPTTNGGGGSCVPGQSIACTCTSGDAGAQVCNQTGTAYGACECEGGGSNSDSDSTPTTDPGTSTDPGTTTDPGTSTDPGTTTDPGTSTEPDTMTSTSEPDTTTGGATCDDPGPEPNEDEDSAVDLETQACDDEAKTITGVLNGDADVDWFQFHGEFGALCGFGDPEVAHQLTAGDDVRLCVFVDCDMGNPDFDCPNGSTANDSPDGRPGCCGAGDIAFGLNCMGGEENAQIYVRVDQAPADACVDYEVQYSYSGG